MTDEEINQYIASINPIYSPAIKANLSRIKDKLKEFQKDHERLNRLIYKPPIKPVDQPTWDRERERQEAINSQLNDLGEKINKLHTKQHIARYRAQKLGVQDERVKIGKMPRNEIRDVQRQAEILNLLDNRCLQLQEVCKLLVDIDVTQAYTISFGETGDLRGSWEDAADAVTLTSFKTLETDVVGLSNEIDSASNNKALATNKNDQTDSCDEKSSAFDPLPISGIAKIFPLDKDEIINQLKWKEFAARASRNKFNNTRVSKSSGRGNSKFDPLLVGDWLVKKGIYSKDTIDRKLAANLPERSRDLKDLFLP